MCVNRMLIAAQHDFVDARERIDVYAGNLVNEITRELIERIGVETGVPDFAWPKISTVRSWMREGTVPVQGTDPYCYEGRAVYFNSVRMPSVIHELIDGHGDTKSRAKGFLELLRKNDLADDGESFEDAMKRPEAVAFCLGLDDAGSKQAHDPVRKTRHDFPDLPEEIVNAIVQGRTMDIDEVEKAIGGRRFLCSDAPGKLVVAVSVPLEKEGAITGRWIPAITVHADLCSRDNNEEYDNDGEWQASTVLTGKNGAYPVKAVAQALFEGLAERNAPEEPVQPMPLY